MIPVSAIIRWRQSPGYTSHPVDFSLNTNRDDNPSSDIICQTVTIVLIVSLMIY